MDTVTTPVRPRPTRRPGAPRALDELGGLEQLVEVAQRMTPAASRAASVTRSSPASEPRVGDGGRLRLVAPADLDGHDRLAHRERPVGQGEEPLGSLEPLDEQHDRVGLGVVEAVGEVVAHVEDHLGAAPR